MYWNALKNHTITVLTSNLYIPLYLHPNSQYISILGSSSRLAGEINFQGFFSSITMYLPLQALMVNEKLANLETTQVGIKYAPHHILLIQRTHKRKTMCPNAQVMYVMSFLCYRPFMLPRQWLYLEYLTFSNCQKYVSSFMIMSHT